MFWIPDEEQREALDGIYKTTEKCPKCDMPLFFHDGGNQGGVPHEFCKNCPYERY